MTPRMLYRNFTDQASIDAEYNPLLKVTEAADIVKRWQQNSAHARSVLTSRLGLRFGPTVEEYLDIFPSGKPGAGLHLFLHGGYWRRFSARDFSFIAPTLVDAGISVGIMNYALCPGVTLSEIVRQTRSAIFWLKENGRSHGVDATSLTVSGHSAGAHLLTMALSTDWGKTFGLKQEVITGACAISGIYDLAPLLYSYLQPQIQLSWGDVAHLSPIRHIPDKGPALTVVSGGKESNEFIRQSQEFLSAWRQHGLKGDWLNLSKANHFNILDGFEDPGSVLFKTITNIARY